MKYLLLYEAADDFRPAAAANLAAHRAWLHEFHDRGTLLMAGPLGDPADGSSLAVFTSQEAAKEFAAGDPFVCNGVVAQWYVREWNEVLAQP